MEELKLKILKLVSDQVWDADLNLIGTRLDGILEQYEIREIPADGLSQDVRDKIELYLAAKKIEGLSPLSLKNYRLILNKFARTIGLAVNEITVNDIRRYLAGFAKHKPSTIGTIVTCIKCFFRWLYDEEIIVKDPAKKIKAPKREKRLPKALDIAELELMRDSCKTLRERALVEALYSTGCRLSELVNLNKADINIADGSARVIGKGNKERIVFFSEKALYHLRKYILSRSDQEEALFVTLRKPYRRVKGRAIQKEIARVAARTELKKRIHPHVMRHTLATLMLNNGADISSVQGILGHESPATTQIYAQQTETTKKENYRRFHVQ